MSKQLADWETPRMQDGKPKILIVIPVYNHADTIRDVVSRALANHDHVLVVDDGSTDGSSERLEGINIPIVRHPQNRGKGCAIITAAREAAQRGMTHIITIDSDGQHNPDDIHQFWPILHENPAAVIVGNRDFNGKDIPGSTRFGRRFSNFWFRVQTGFPLGDTQSGFRAYPVFALMGLKLLERHYSFETEVLVKAAWAGIRIYDVGISVYYPPKAERISHFNKFRDNLRLTLLNTRLTMRALLPWPHQKLHLTEPQPSVSIFHLFRSVRMLLSEHATPGRLAASGGLGIVLGTLPLIGFHTLAILFAASFFRLNKAFAVAASQLTAPPVFPALCIELGYFLRNGTFLTEVSIQTLGREALHRIYEWLIGAIILGPIAGATLGACIYLVACFISRKEAKRSG